jgi:hypothetical protein
MDRADFVYEDMDEEPSPEADDYESDDDDNEMYDVYRWVDEDYEPDGDCSYVDVEPLLKEFAQKNLGEDGQKSR